MEETWSLMKCLKSKNYSNLFNHLDAWQHVEKII